VNSVRFTPTPLRRLLFFLSLLSSLLFNYLLLAVSPFAIGLFALSNPFRSLLLQSDTRASLPSPDFSPFSMEPFSRSQEKVRTACFPSLLLSSFLPSFLSFLTCFAYPQASVGREEFLNSLGKERNKQTKPEVNKKTRQERTNSLRNSFSPLFTPFSCTVSPVYQTPKRISPSKSTNERTNSCEERIKRRATESGRMRLKIR